MKVLQINVVCGTGSTGRIVTDIADQLMLEGHQCRIAYGRGEVPKKYKNISVRIGNGIDTIIHVAMTRIFDLHGYFSKKATLKFINWVEQWNPDVIHLHNIHGYYINLEVLFDYLRECKKKIVWTLHDCWAFTGHCAYFDGINCNKWIDGCYSCEYRKKYPASFLFDNSMKNWKNKKKLFSGINNLTLITPSKWLAELANKSFLSEYSIKIINNGIDTNSFRKKNSTFKKTHDLLGKKILLGMASVWSERKGLSDFFKLSKLISKEYVIVLVGVPKNHQSKNYNNIIYLNKIKEIDVLVDVYNSATVFLNLTYSDNYPTVNLEAQACGVPVITYKTGGSIESVPYENVAEKGDVQSIIKKIQFSKLAIKKQDFSIERFVKEYLKIYIECN